MAGFRSTNIELPILTMVKTCRIMTKPPAIPTTSRSLPAVTFKKVV